MRKFIYCVFVFILKRIFKIVYHYKILSGLALSLILTRPEGCRTRRMQLSDPKLVVIMNIVRGSSSSTQENQLKVKYMVKMNRLYRRTGNGLKWVVPTVGEFLKAFTMIEAIPGWKKRCRRSRKSFGSLECEIM